jgi:hypothetical protein
MIGLTSSDVGGNPLISPNRAILDGKMFSIRRPQFTALYNEAKKAKEGRASAKSRGTRNGQKRRLRNATRRVIRATTILLGEG